MTKRAWKEVCESATIESSYGIYGETKGITIEKDLLDLTGVSATAFFDEARDQGFTSATIVAKFPLGLWVPVTDPDGKLIK